MSTAASAKPASFLSSTAGRDKDPAMDIPGMPPNFGDPTLPHAITFQGILSSISRVYRSPDEAIRHDRNNARFMRNDPTIMECVEQRQRSTALLNWHLEAEDQKDGRQKQLCEDLRAIIEQTPRFMQYRENLLHALWYGKYGIQHRYRWKKVRGQMRVIVDRWLPINGDKICFRYDDGTGTYDPDQIGIRVGPGFTSGGDVARKWSDGRQRKVEPTDYGLAYFLESYERRQIALHKHMIEDGEYEDAQSAGKIHGLGIRSRIYWSWYQKQESLAWLMEFLERSAFGLEVWYYPWGNKEALEKTKTAAMDRVGNGRNIIFMPKPMDESGGMAYGLDRVEANMAGAEVLRNILKEYFGHQIKRYILGQTLTTEADSTGLGSNLASIHLDTYLQIIRYDATNLEETLTTEFVEPLKLFNFPEFRDVSIRFRIDTEAADVEGKLSAWERAWNMGVKLRAQDVMDMIGASKPESDEDVLLNPQAQAAAQAAAGNPMVPGGLGGELPIGQEGQPNDPNEQPNEEIPGGVADGMAPADFPEEALRKGVTHELEHTDDPQVALEIAGDHLAEDPGYYDKLDDIEEDGPSAFERDLLGDGNEPQKYSRDTEERLAAAVAATETDPSDEQKQAGNYRKGKLRLHGLEISIENPAGSTRSGTAADGTRWSVKMPWHYGYIKKHVSEADGDHVDAFLGPNPDSEIVYVVDQCKPGGRFDEHKCMIGWNTAEEAEAAYWSAYDEGYQGTISAVVPLTIGAFKNWLAKGDTGRPIEGQVEQYRGAFVDFEEAMHPRGKPKNKGQFAPKGGGQQGGGEGGKKSRKKEKLPLFAGDRKPKKAPGDVFTVRLGSRTWDLRRHEGQWFARINGLDFLGWDQVSPKLTKAVEKQVVKHNKARVLDAIGSGINRGRDIAKQLKLSQDDFLDAFFELEAEGQAYQNQKSGKLFLGKAPPERAPAEQQPKPTATGSRTTAGHEDVKRLIKTAVDHQVPADDLLDAAQFVLEEKEKHVQQRETAKADARRLTGMTQQDVARLENQGFDYTSGKNVPGVTGEKLRRFDEYAQEIARQHPGVLGNADDQGADFAAGLWDLLREGKQDVPRLYDPEVLDEAAKFVAIHRPGDAAEPPSDEEAIPFARRGEVERYARWKAERDRQEQIRFVAELADGYFAEHFAKQAGAGQRSFNWTDEDERKHPRNADGEFAKKGEGEAAKPDQKTDSHADYSSLGKTVKDLFGNQDMESPEELKTADAQPVEATGKDELAAGEDDQPAPASVGDPSQAGQAATETAGDETPRQVAEADYQAAKESQYAYARESAIPNAGEDIVGSARHRANAWRGLEEAEKDGTAEKLVTRDMLLRNEPHNLMDYVAENPLSALAMYWALRSFPAQPGFRRRLRKPSAEEAQKNRRQYLEAFRRVKEKATEIAAQQEDPIKACREMGVFVQGLIKEYRGQTGDSRMSEQAASDRYNDTANALCDLQAKCYDTYRKTGLAYQTAQFAKVFNEKYPDLPAGEKREKAADHVADILEGASLNKAFGKSGDKGKKKSFNPADVYVKTAKREGGADLGLQDGNAAVAYLGPDGPMKLRGIQFGNYVTDEERAHHAIRCAEAFADLQSILGIPMEYISWKGTLGIAFGARGHGTASAHYEPGGKNINLTRASGAGSLAHEWGHFIDHALADFGISRKDADSGRSSGDYASEQTSAKRLVKNDKQEWEPVDRSSDPIWKAFEGIRQAWFSSGFRVRLKEALSKAYHEGSVSRPKYDYFNSGREVLARSFEKHVQRKLAKDGRKNTYLAGGMSHEFWPTDEEADAIAPAFDALFEELRTGIEQKRYSLEDADGEVVFRSIAGEASALADQLRAAFAVTGF